MALLDAPTRALIGAAIQRVWSAARETCSFTKPELLAAVDAADQWRDDNAAAFNTALPAAFRTKATPAQKALLLCYVVMKNAGEIVRGEQ